jgi:hypothetical protein
MYDRGMYPRLLCSNFVGILITVPASSLPTPSQEDSVSVSQAAGSAFDLVNAVNALRTSNGFIPAHKT